MTTLGFFSILAAVVALVSLVLLGRSRARQQELEAGMELQDSYLQDLFERSDDPDVGQGTGDASVVDDEVTRWPFRFYALHAEHWQSRHS